MIGIFDTAAVATAAREPNCEQSIASLPGWTSDAWLQVIRPASSEELIAAS
jgi:hypothetical protein